MDSIALSAAEQRVLGKLPQGVFFSTKEVGRVLDPAFGHGYLVELLDRLVSKRALLRIKRGLYYYGKISDKDFRNRAGFEYANGKAYLAFGTALHYHGFIDQVPTAYHYATAGKRMKTTLFGASYVFTPLGKHYFGTMEANGFRTSSKAKTVFDCLLKPRLVGGESTVIDALVVHPPPKSDWKELLGYFTRGASSGRMLQKTGYLLEQANAAPHWFLQGLHAALGRHPAGITVIKKGGRFNKRWKVYA